MLFLMQQPMFGRSHLRIYTPIDMHTTQTSEVTAHFQNRAGKQVTVYVIKFEPFVLERSEK